LFTVCHKARGFRPQASMVSSQNDVNFDW